MEVVMDTPPPPPEVERARSSSHPKTPKHVKWFRIGDVRQRFDVKKLDIKIGLCYKIDTHH